MKKHLFFFLLLFSGTAFSQSWEELNKQAVELYNKGEYEKAIPIAEKTAETAKKILGQGHPSYAIILNNLVLLYKRTGQFQKAELPYTELKNIRKKTLGKTHPSYAAILNNLAFLYENIGQFEKAESLYIELKDIKEEVWGDRHPDYAISLNNLALLYKKMAQYEKAEQLYLQSKDIIKKALGDNHPDYATSLSNLAGLYESMGKYEKAESLYIKSKDIQEKTFGKVHLSYATSLNNLALLYKKIGQFEKAEQLYLKSIEIRKKLLGETHPEIASTLHNLAALYVNIGQYEQAESLYLKSIEIWSKSLGEIHPEIATGLNSLAVLYRHVGQFEKAEHFYLESIEIRKKLLGETHPDFATSLNSLAVLYGHIGQFGKAESLHLKSINIREKALGEKHPDNAASLNDLAALYVWMNQYSKAENYLMKSNHIVIDNLKKVFTALAEKEKINYLDNNIYLNTTNNGLLFKYPEASSGFFKECYNLQLLFKSLSLSDTKSSIDAIRKSSDEAVIALYEEWQTNKNILSKQYTLAISEQRKDLKEFESKTESLEKELNRRSASFKKNQESFQITSQNVWAKIQDKEAAIEFVKFRLYNKKWTDSVMYAAYVLRKNDSIPLFIPLCEERQLQKLFDSAGVTPTKMVKSFYRGLRLRNTNGSSFLGTALYKLVWKPIEPYLKGIKKISYSPAGKLFSVAFQALSMDSNTMLMDKYELQQYTSTRQVALRTEGKQNIKPTSITLFGNASFTMDSLQLENQKTGNASTISTSIYTPQNKSGSTGSWKDLPATAEEVKKIKALFDENKISTKEFTQTAASEENLKALDGRSPQILHIATHGFFLPEPDKKRNENFGNENVYILANDPLLRSGLILSGGNYAWSGKTPIDGVEDGIATAYEISQLNLSNTELVVLSACETALGDVKGSEGVFGLQRAFKMAGVKKMIVSLWQVPDKETAELMTAFYSYWMKGKTIEESFIQAQADMRKKYAPFYWAAFVLVE